jgi:hypothetical protein
MKTITLECDNLDYEWLNDAVAYFQKHKRMYGDLLLADGEGDLDARILAEICRLWMEHEVTA